MKRLLSENIQTGRVGHAYLFCGPEGIGRKTMARCFAEALTCETGGADPCGACEACILNRSGTNPDIVWIRQQEGKASVGVEDVRSVQEEIATAPRFGKYKILLFEHAGKADGTGAERFAENAGRTAAVYRHDPDFFQ